MMNFLREKVVGEILEKNRVGCDFFVWRRRRRRKKERKEYGGEEKRKEK
jgi:hypothetical protein